MISPKDHLDLNLANRVQKFCTLAAIAILIISIFALVGWYFHIPIFKSLFPQFEPMNPLSAICFVSLGIVLLCLKTPAQNTQRRIVKNLVGSILALVSITQLLVMTGSQIRLDNLLFVDQIGANQMAPNSALTFLFCALSIIFLDRKRNQKIDQRISQVFAMLAAIISLLVINGYIYRSNVLIHTGGFFPMALSSALAFFIFSIGILCARATEGLMEILVSDDTGGMMSRRLFPIVGFVPPFLGWICLTGRRLGFYDQEFGMAIFSILTVTILITLTWWIAKSLSRMDRAYREQATLIELILEQIGDGVAVANQKGKFVLFNPAAERIIGMQVTSESSEVWSKYFGVFYPDTITPYPTERLPIVEAINGIETNDVEQFLRNAKKPGGVFVSVTGRPLLNQNKEILGGVVVIRDITERKQEEDRIRKINKDLETMNIELFGRSHSAAKMASLGEMAAGVGHEVNNPLTAIIGSIDETLEDISDGKIESEKLVQSLKSMKSTSLRIAKIIRSLKSFARDGSRDPIENYSLAKIFQETVELCREKIRYKDIEFNVDNVSESLFLPCRPTEIAQALLNLIGNAQDAVKNLAAKWIHVSVSNESDWVEISVTDSGRGISSEIKAKLFQPFFTTKEVGKGTGLGLSISREMIIAHGGSLELDSQSINTRFVIRLPKNIKKETSVNT